MASMTPQEKFEYKRKWLPGYVVSVCSDSRFAAQDWCKNYCEQHEWALIRDVEPYIDQYMFEHQNDAVLFEEVFRERKESQA